MSDAAHIHFESTIVQVVDSCIGSRHILDGSHFPIHKITEPAALTRSIAVHTTVQRFAARCRVCCERAITRSTSGSIRVSHEVDLVSVRSLTA